jgi:serine/threonine protein kinase
LIADYGIKEIGKGSFKRAKTILQIGGETRVRLTSAKKARERELQTLIEKEGALGEKADAAKLQKFHDELAKLQSTFLLDIGGEDKAREVLKDVPNIAGMTKIQYWSREKPGKPSQLKTRYIMTKYEGDLWSLAITSTEQADHEKALRCCMGVFDCLQKMHEKGFVHGDLKLFNVLFKGDTGFVSDFGFCREEGCPFPHVGNPVYMAPEGVFGSNKLYNKSMDMFSFGIMLLAIVDPSRYLQWEEAMKELKKIKTGDGAKPQDQYKQTYLDSHATLMADLAKRQDPICKELIVPLLNLDPEKRPKINAAKETFTRLLKGPKVRP